MIELSDQEHHALTNVLRAPALWPLAVVAGEVGLARALDACRSRDLPPEAADACKVAGYTADDLPGWREAQHVVAGVRVTLAKSAEEPLQRTARRLGLTLRQAQAGLRTLDALGASVRDYEVLRDGVRLSAP